MRYRSILAGIAGMFISTTGMAQYINLERSHIISCAPVEISGNGYGSGLSWEHFLGHEDWLSFMVPVTVTVNPDGTNVGHMFYINPGIKMYTNMHGYRRAKVSLGPSLFAGAGRGGNERNYYPYYYSNYSSRFMYGGMLNVGLNWFPTPHIYLGVDYGLGVTSVNKYDGVNGNTYALNRLALRIGYNFKTKQPIREDNAPVMDNAAPIRE